MKRLFLVLGILASLMLTACHGGGDGKTSEPYHGGDGKAKPSDPTQPSDPSQPSDPTDPTDPSDPSDPSQSPELTSPKAVQTFEGSDIKVGVYKSGCIKNDINDKNFYIKQGKAFSIETNGTVKSSNTGSYIVYFNLTPTKFSFWVEQWKDENCSVKIMHEDSAVLERDVEEGSLTAKDSSTINFKLLSLLSSDTDLFLQAFTQSKLAYIPWKITASPDNTESITLTGGSISSTAAENKLQFELSFIDKTKDEALNNYLVRRDDFIEPSVVYESSCFNDVCENGKCMFTEDPQPQSYKFQMTLDTGMLLFGRYTSSLNNCTATDDIISSISENPTTRSAYIFSKYGEENKATVFYSNNPDDNEFRTVADFTTRYLRDLRCTHTGYNNNKVYNNRLYLLKTKNNNQEVIYVSLTEDNLNKAGISAADSFTSFRQINESTYSTIPPLKFYKK